MKLTVYGEPSDFLWAAQIAGSYLATHATEGRATASQCILYVGDNDSRKTIAWGDREHVRVRILKELEVHD